MKTLAVVLKWDSSACRFKNCKYCSRETRNVDLDGMKCISVSQN